MADYVVDINGNITKTKKKKKKTSDYVVDMNGNISKVSSDDVAPVKEKKLDFFQKSSVFDDGYDFGDVTKTILGTAGEVGLEAAKGVASMGEGLLDLTSYGMAAIGDKYGDPEYAKKLRENAKKNRVEQITERADDFLEQYSVLGRTSDAIAGGIGQVGSIILTGGLAGAAGLGTAGATALTTGAIGLSGMGSGMSEAYQSGASDKEAAIYGAISGGAEALSEMLFGGLGKAVNAVGLSKGLSSLDDALAKKVASKFSSQITKNIAEFGIKASAEGVEEVVSGVASAIGKKLTYMSDEDLTDLLKDENLMEQFIVGTVTSGISQSGIVPGMKTGSLVESNKTGRDFITGLTATEQKVIDKEVENRIAKQEEDGTKLTAKDKAKIEEAVIADMDKGYISVDTIESVLGGDTYKAHSTLSENEKAMREEYTTLNRMKAMEMTGEQTDRKAELKAKLDEIGTSKDNLMRQVFDTAKDSRLSESYREIARKGEKFQADPERTFKNEAAEKTMQNIIDSGLMDNTNRSHEFADFMTKISEDRGYVFEVTTTEKLQESVKNGNPYGINVDPKRVEAFVSDSKKRIVVNLDAGKSLNSLVGHEITHTLEQTDAYKELQDAVFRYAESKGEYRNRLWDTKKRYRGTSADVHMEMTSDMLGDYLFTDSDFITNLSTEKPNIFKKIYNEIKYLWKMATAGSQEARELERVKKAFDKAWKEASEASEDVDDGSSYTDVKYSVKVSDKDTLEFLDEQIDRGEYDAETNPDGGYYVTYKSMSFWGYDDDGNAILRSPMAEYVDGKLSDAYLIPADKNEHNWYQATETIDDTTGLPSGLLVKTKLPGNKTASYLPASENQHLIADDWSNLFFKLTKKVQQKDGKWKTSDVPARYNPYEHSSNSMLNDQFSAAYLRDNLVTVKMYVPISEDNGAYRAQWSKDPTGWADWKSGLVATKINKQKDLQRRVFLSRYATPVEIVPDSEVAQAYKEYVAGTDVAIPDNVVSPNLLNELKKAGVPIEESGKVKYSLSSLDDIKAKYKDKTDYLFMHEKKDGTISLDNMVVKDEYRNQGIGTQILNDVIAYADKNGKTITLTPTSEFGTKAKLAKWYKQNGFVENKGRNADYRLSDTMYRLPESVKYSMSDTNGRELTAEQQNHFKDSKVRDEDGNLKVLYHGSRSKVFTEFDLYEGVWLTPDQSYAQIYSDSWRQWYDDDEVELTTEEDVYVDPKYRIYEMYANITNPADIGEIDGWLSDGKVRQLAKALNMRYTELKPMADEYMEEYTYMLTRSHEFIELAKEKGFDGFKATEGGKETWCAFSAEDQVKLTTNTKPTSNTDIRYSLSDSDGNQLTEGQQEYFKDSKVRDENGSLKVMYHGTPNAGFTEFKGGTYFTEHKWYADRYQNQGASSLGYKKTANAPDTYAVYLNIKKPFDTRNQAERDIFYNEYYRQWGMGTDLMESGLPDWMDGEDLREFIEENGYDYDGLILDEGGVGGYGDEVVSRGLSYVVFSPEQVKNVDNANPTADSDIRFSLSDSVEETRDLIAVHNLTSEKLLKSLKLGGLPMHSVAIAKAQDGHSEFGDISLVLTKDAIDPQVSDNNKLYSGDAWTPTYPRVEYKADDKVRRKLQDKFRNLVPYEIQDVLGNIMLDSDNVSDMLNRYDGNMADAFKRDDAMKYAYLKDTGSDISLPMKEADLYHYGNVSNDAVRYFAGKLVGGLQAVESYRNMSARDLLQDKDLTEAVADAQNFDVLRSFEPGSEEYLEYERNPVFRADEVAFRDIDNLLSATRKLFRSGTQQTVDRKAAREVIRDTVDQAEYEAWLEEQFSGFVEKEGIRNNQDLFTRSGNRRSFEALHYEHNLENVIKAMREKGEKGIGGFGGGNIFGASATEFSSIEDMKRSSDRLQNLSEEDFKEIKEGFSDRFFEIARSLPNDKRSFVATDDAANMLTEAVSKYSTRRGIANYIRRELQGWGTYSDQAVDDLIELVNDIRNMPTGYFEAKPQRAVGFDEVGVFVIPNNVDVKLKQELLNGGYSIAEYDPNVEGDRKRVVNEFEQFKFSLADTTQPTKEYGNFNIYGKDIKYNDIKYNDIAPVQEATPVQPAVSESDYAPMTEAHANERDEMQSNLYSLDETRDMPPEEEYMDMSDAEDPFMDAPAPAPKYAKSPFADKDINEVGNRKVKAYMYENPEVKPFFQAEAQVMLGELENSIKGEKHFNDQLYYDTNGEQGWFGTTRETSYEIAYLLDNFKYTYKQIEEGLKDIIEDHGKENNAVSKRIEFMLDERLRNGYSYFMSNDYIPANQDYINLLNEKNVTEYNDEAFANWVRTEADRVAPAEDIAPVAEEYEAIKPEKPKKQPKMVKLTYEEMLTRIKEEQAGDTSTHPLEDLAKKKAPENSPVANVLVEEPALAKKKNRFWSQAMELVVDKGMVFENLAKKTKNRELEAKWNFIRYSDSKAQDMIGNGAEGVRSLNDIQTEVQNAGLTRDLYNYLYHLHNVDRMSLAQRYDGAENKAVFGDSVTAEQSRKIASDLEKKTPALKVYAEQIYAYNDYLRGLLVDGGVISQETADLWQEMYPHYVPIRRVDSKGLNINVPLDTRRTGINAPIKRATGGSSDILPLFDTMAQRTFQTYKAVARNRFGVELLNTLDTAIQHDVADVDTVIDGVGGEELLQKGKNGGNPTFTVFEGGEKVTFEISEDMYDALKPTNEVLAYTNKVANTASNLHRGLLTEYNIAFMATNAIKDAQDVLINSQHPAKTYKNFPAAIKELARKGHWYQEYVKNGGEQNTYFDKQENTFVKEEKTGIKKLIGIPLDAISAGNNFIEKIPRLAEYIASRESGASIEVAMLDSARVTTNFAAGGDLTKFLNRNGATFLNASVQGVAQQVRNIREAKMNGFKGCAQLATKFALAGLPAALLNGLMWDDDEEYEELSDYVKQNYYVVAKYGDGKFVRIPKGRTLAVIQSAFEQTMNALSGNDEADLKSFLELVVSNLAPNNPIEDNILAPIIQVKNNRTWYGDDLVPTRLQDLPAEEQFDETTDALSKWLGEKTGTSPYKWNYVLDQYSGVGGDVIMPMFTPEAESGDDSLMGNLMAPIKSKFTTDSVLKNQNVSDFYDMSDKLTTNAKRSGATDEDKLKSKYFNSVSGQMSELYAEKRQIQNSGLSDSEKYYQVRELQKQIDALAKNALSTYNNVQIDGPHATVGDRQYRLNDGAWEKLDSKQIEKQDKVTKSLGISASAYWSNKEEYDYAYEYPEKYQFLADNGMTVADYYDLDESGKDAYTWAFKNPEKYKTSKVISDDLVEYRRIASEIYDIPADKDADGKSISGSKKAKVVDYINGLDLDYGQKIILFKSQYEADDTYNADIVDYLSSLDYLSYEDIVEILTELNFKVTADGTVTWD